MKKLSQYLRELARRGQHGQVRTPASIILLPGGFWHGYNQAVVPDIQTWEQVVKLSERYRRFVHHCKEVAPGWEKVHIIHYADNSVAEVQQDRIGNQREVMIEAPHGDVCF